MDVEIRVEWAKSRSRVACYGEEIKIVQEEMRRCLRFWVWKADWWTSLTLVQDSRSLSPYIVEGMKAYARRQAAMCLGLKLAFEEKWEGTEEMVTTSYRLAENAAMWYELKDKEEAFGRLTAGSK